MSGYLWKYYLQDDVANFRQVLESATYSTRTGSQRGHAGGQSNIGLGIGSPGSLGTSPTLRKRHDASPAAASTSSINLTRSDINHRDPSDRTLLHLASSSSTEFAFEFATALLEHPLTDLYLQDAENGWTALHRAFYAGNISIAQAILSRDTEDTLGKGAGHILHHAGGLVKIKDKEGNGPFDLLEMTLDGASDSGDEVALDDGVDLDEDSSRQTYSIPYLNLNGDETYTFGSNKNVTLGFGDEDDRQFPGRVVLRRPEHLYYRFHREHVESQPSASDSSTSNLSRSGVWSLSELPAIILNKPIRIQDVQMSKLHSAILTTDPESNLYICGHGSGGRIGTGDESTRYHFVCVEGGALAHKKVTIVALGQNHTLALSSKGEIFSWGSNGFGQLGYALPKVPGKDELVQLLPRQVFGPLKGETVTGVAASRLHSVAHTSTFLYTFGKNDGQLGIFDSAARSLEIQDTPRKVAASLFSAPIASVSAIDRATTCLLKNNDVWVFANYGYAKLQFRVENPTDHFLRSSFRATKYKSSPKISKVISGDDTICALSSSGEIFTVAVSQPSAIAQSSTASTTNPGKIRNALSSPQLVWSNKKSHMAARDVDVDQNGSIILVTHAGSVWRRVKRAKIEDASTADTKGHKRKDYKYSRISGLTRVSAVRASGFGAYAAVREDCTKTREGIGIIPANLWLDIQALMPFRPPGFASQPLKGKIWLPEITEFVLSSTDLDRDIEQIILRDTPNGLPYDVHLSLPASELAIPVHSFILAARSRVLRHGIDDAKQTGSFSVPDLLTVHRKDDGPLIAEFQGIDTYALFDLVLYLYAEELINFSHITPMHPRLHYRYRQTRPEILKLASKLELSSLESAVKHVADIPHTLECDMEQAINDPVFFNCGDVIVQLADNEIRVHGALVCQRCPFFEGLFKGRAGGQWLSERRQELDKPSDAIRVDLGHVESAVFHKVLRHIYAGTGPELFDDVLAGNLDEFLDKVIQVLGVANELMLDRLSEICQHVIGKYVTVRNVCQLANALAPCSVQTFKKRALEYICLNLEAVLQNGHLEDLEDDLLTELDEVSRQLQRDCSVIARSGRLETELLDRNPTLHRRIEQERQAKIDSIHVLNKYADVDNRASSSFKAGSFHELSETPTPQRTRRRPSKGSPSPGASPALKGKSSSQDLLFDMDEEDEEELSALPSPKELLSPITQSRQPGVGASSWQDTLREQRRDFGEALVGNAPPAKKEPPSPRDPGRPWGASPLPSAKLDMKAIMEQASASRTSNISLGLSAKQKSERRPSGSFKMSQKERKRMQQAQHQSATPSPGAESPTTPKSASPWSNFPSKAKPTSSSNMSSLPTPPPQLTMRQTLANPSAASKDKTSSLLLTHTPQSHAQSNPFSPNTQSSAGRSPAKAGPSGASLQPQPSTSTTPSKQPVIQSIRHTPKPTSNPTARPEAKPFAIADIVAEEQGRKDKLKEAVAPRSLQDIQAEQEFQEWWDKESKRVREEEAARKREEKRAARRRRGGRGAGRENGRGGRENGESAREERDPGG